MRAYNFRQFALVATLACAQPAAADWTTFGGSAKRLSYNASETVLSNANVGGLKQHWKTHIPYQSDTQPLFVGQVATAGGTHDEVFVTTENGAVYALNAGTGAIDWTTTVASVPGCPGHNIFGIYGTPTIDTTAQLMYLIDGNGAINALDIRTGVQATGYPVQLVDQPNQASTYNHSSPTLVNGMLYVTTSAHCESPTVPFHGQVIEFNPANQQIVQRFYPVGNGAVFGGGIWGPGGVSAEYDGSALYAATGNALAATATTPHAEQVLQLDTNLNLLAANGPALSKNGDFDFGTTPTLIDAPGCAPMLGAMNKTGSFLVYNRGAIASGALQTLNISVGGGNSSFIGMASYDPVLHVVYINNPIGSADGSFANGLIALQVTTGCTLGALWQQHLGTNVISPFTRATPPVLANGVAWMSTGAGKQLVAVDEVTGAILWTSGATITGNTNFSPTVANGQVFVQGGQAFYAFGL